MDGYVRLFFDDGNQHILNIGEWPAHLQRQAGGAELYS